MLYVLVSSCPAFIYCYKKPNKSVVPIQCDITSKNSLAAAAAQVEKESGFVNSVIANSGATGPDLYGLPKDRKPTFEEIQKYLWDTPMESFNQAFEVNTTACFYTLVAFLKLLDAGNKSDVSRSTGVKSQFVVTGSIGAFSRRPGMGFAYAGSKMAVCWKLKYVFPD
jgi:NAD(P)-dependent dehydrogenase (short-subunit alcohol dehydrogenase family)